MVQTLDFVRWAERHPSDKKMILDALSAKEASQIVIDRFKLDFDPASRYVIVDKVSDDVPFAVKIAKCRLPYDVLYRLLDGNYDDLTGLEWL